MGTIGCSEQLEPILGQQKLEQTRGAEQRQRDWEWERYLACTYIPHPKYVLTGPARPKPPKQACCRLLFVLLPVVSSGRVPSCLVHVCVCMLGMAGADAHICLVCSVWEGACRQASCVLPDEFQPRHSPALMWTSEGGVHYAQLMLTILGLRMITQCIRLSLSPWSISTGPWSVSTGPWSITNGHHGPFSLGQPPVACACASYPLIAGAAGSVIACTVPPLFNGSTGDVQSLNRSACPPAGLAARELFPSTRICGCLTLYCVAIMDMLSSSCAI